jgi:hypothetical protein
MLRAVSVLAVLFVLPLDAEHPCSSHPAKIANPAVSNNVVRLMFIVDPYSVYDCSSKEEGSEFFVKLQKELSLQTAAWLINVDITVIKKKMAIRNRYSLVRRFLHQHLYKRPFMFDG